MVVSYDGTGLGGWQVQPKVATVQSILQEILSRYIGRKVSVVGAGRTDAGVHAFAQVAHFSLNNNDRRNPDDLVAHLNQRLPPAISIRSILPVPEGFHARRDAAAKIYRYYLHTTLQPKPFYHLYSIPQPHPFYPPLLRAALPLFCGTRDFTTFSNKMSGNLRSHHFIKTLYAIRWVRRTDHLYLEFEGSGFLYKMVRNLVATLLEIGSGKRGLHTIPKLFKAKDRRLIPPPAPSKALFLSSVRYSLP